MNLLETERLVLRQFEPGDARHLFELDNDPEVMRFINGGIHTPLEVIEQDILPRFLSYDNTRPEFGFWAALYKETKTFAGWFSIRLIADEPRAVSLGYRLHRAFWGQGLATEGAQALIHKGFAELGVERIVATTYEKNLASQRVLEKLGMKVLRRFRYSQEDLEHSDTAHSETLELWDGDDLEYGLGKEEWLASSG